MFWIVAEVFGIIKNWFSAHNWVFLGTLCVVWLVCSWFVGSFARFVGGLGGFWLVCDWFGWFVDGVWVVWMVCGWFGWFVGGLAGFGWFRVLQLTSPWVNTRRCCVMCNLQLTERLQCFILQFGSHFYPNKGKISVRSPRFSRELSTLVCFCNAEFLITLSNVSIK